MAGGVKKLSQREQGILIVTIVVVITFGVYHWVIGPMRAEGENIDERINMARRHLASSNKVIATSSQVDQEYTRLLDLIGASGPEGQETSFIISAVESAAAEAGVHINNMQPQRVVTKEGYHVFSVQLSVDSQWSSMAKFLYIVQSPPNVLNVEDMSLERYSDTTGSLRGQLTLARVRVIPQGE